MQKDVVSSLATNRDGEATRTSTSRGVGKYVMEYPLG